MSDPLHEAVREWHAHDRAIEQAKAERDRAASRIENLIGGDGDVSAFVVSDADDIVTVQHGLHGREPKIKGGATLIGGIPFRVQRWPIRAVLK